MIKGIIFDFDGLLADTEIVSYKIYKTILEKYGHDYTKQDYSQGYSGKTEVINVNNLINTYRLPLEFDACFKLVIDTEKELLKQGVDLKPGAIELLSFLKEKSIKTIIASSSTRDRALGILRQHDIESMFDDFVFAEDISHSKPDPEIFLKAKDKLGLNNDECFVIEDSENGIEAGYRAGIPVICVPDMKMPKDEYLHKTRYVVRTLDEIISVLNEC